mgnify:CR=1 FL=1
MRWKFLLTVIGAYMIVLIIDLQLFVQSLQMFLDILVRILPVFVVVLLIMALTNRFVTKKFIVNHLKKKGIVKWIFAVVGGILSMGPIYMWYPMLADLKKKGLTDGLIACFLYNRAIKLPLLPVAIYYFGFYFIVLLTILMVLASIAQGFMIDRFVGTRKDL